MIRKSLLALMLLGSTFARAAEDVYTERVRPILKKYCFECHSETRSKGDLDLERFGSPAEVRKDVRPWEHLLERVEVGEMPPKGSSGPNEVERRVLLSWVREMLTEVAKARKGDPGHVPLRRLSNAEYDRTIRDLTGIDLQPTRDFPADGAAGEGFTNAAESLSDITPPLLTRYLKTAKDIAEHVVLLPEGFRFGPGTTLRDRTDASTERLRAFYRRYTSDGRLAIRPYLVTTVRHRQALSSGKTTIAEVATKEKLRAKYLGILWEALTARECSMVLDPIREQWRDAEEKDVPALMAEIERRQQALWRFAKIGSYASDTRQVPRDPMLGDSQPIRFSIKPEPGQREVVLHLLARDLAEGEKKGRIRWQRPRLEGAGKEPLLLKDYPELGGAYEIDHSAMFVKTADYLRAASDLAREDKLSLEKLAGERDLDVDLLKRWQSVLGLRPLARVAVPLKLLEQKTPVENNKPWIRGWQKKGTSLPNLVTNSSDEVRHIPGTIPPHKVAMHPTPQELVAVSWTSPVSGKVSITARIRHAHPNCGNGVAWWLEHRRGEEAHLLGEGLLDLGRKATVPGKVLEVRQGDRIVLAVDARDANHYCDLTEIDLTVVEVEKEKRKWNLAADIADSVQAGNPHADGHGNKEVWSFAYGPSKTPKNPIAIPDDSVLGQWRKAVGSSEAGKLAEKVEAVLTGARPEAGPDRVLFDAFVNREGAMLKGLDVRRFAEPRVNKVSFGLPADRFDGADLVALSGSVLKVRLPAALFHDRDFIVDVKVEEPLEERVLLCDVRATAPPEKLSWDGTSPLLASPTSAIGRQLIRELEAFRQLFPWYLCFPDVVPTDEVVSLKMFHREDKPLQRLFLDEEERRRLDHLWAEHRFISRQPILENDYLPQFIGYVTQDQPKEKLEFYLGQRPAFKKRAEALSKDLRAAEPKQLRALLDFAARAYRRPLSEGEEEELLTLYRAMRKKASSHEEALRGVLSRALVAPAFLFRIEKAPAGTKPGPVDDWELATRLSYFLWSSMPDEELREAAAGGKLRDPQVLVAQAQRMLKDDRLRALAIEFGTQWIHVRDFDSTSEKNEKLYPTFDAELRQAMREEAVLLFFDQFQNDRKVTDLFEADHTFLNERLAKHYGIPGVHGPQWRRVEGVRKHGRGGLLGLGAVQAKQSGASRTSPVLRGTWVVETLLGEKLPRPPANVPVLPDVAGGADNLTTRQRVEKHVSVQSCAECHSRIDPYGFAFERFDAIGRWRNQDAGGLAIDAEATLRDGTTFEGVDGLRRYLLEKKRDVLLRQFCKKLLGYALGRATMISDTLLIEEMMAELRKNEGRVSAAILTIVRSPQFRMIRGRDVAAEE